MRNFAEFIFAIGRICGTNFCDLGPKSQKFVPKILMPQHFMPAKINALKVVSKLPKINHFRIHNKCYFPVKFVVSLIIFVHHCRLDQECYRGIFLVRRKDSSIPGLSS